MSKSADLGELIRDRAGLPRCGWAGFWLKVAAISEITNMAAGLSAENISHEHTKSMAPIGAATLEKVPRRYLRDL